MVATFFGHSDCLPDIIPKLKQTILGLIEQKKITLFYVGNQGRFDHYTESILREYKKQYPKIRYYVVLAYLPVPMDGMVVTEPFETIFPHGLEYVPKRFAICKRNEWMIDHADVVVTYVTRPFGGAAKYQELAIKKGKDIIKLA